MDRKFSKFINSTLVVAVLLAVFLWSTVSQNATSDIATSMLEVDLFDVGQGDATLISLPDSTQALIDGGRDSKVLDQLARHMPKFDKKIEYIFATHPDADHIGGLPNVLQNYEVGEFIGTGKTSDSQVSKRLENEISQKKIAVKNIRQGDTVNLSSGANMEILWPDESAAKSETTNNSSEVMRFNYRGATIMLTGDAEVEAQDMILSSEPPEKIKSDILKVAHHGASSAYNKKFLEKVEMESAVISVGKKNSYGHPAKVVLNVLKEMSVKVFRTDEIGTVSFVLVDGKWEKK